VVSFTPRPLYHQEKSPCYQLDRRVGGPQSRSGRGDEEKIPSPCRESNLRTSIDQTVIFLYESLMISSLHMLSSTNRLIKNSGETINFLERRSKKIFYYAFISRIMLTKNVTHSLINSKCQQFHRNVNANKPLC
jgi:hypothetical protein